MISDYEIDLETFIQLENDKLLSHLNKHKIEQFLTDKDIASVLGMSPANYRMKLSALRKGKRPKKFLRVLYEYLSGYI